MKFRRRAKRLVVLYPTLKCDSHSRQQARLTIHISANFAYARGAHAFIETFRVWIGRKFQCGQVKLVCAISNMIEQRAPDAGADVFGFDPHVFNLCQ